MQRSDARRRARRVAFTDVVRLRGTFCQVGPRCEALQAPNAPPVPGGARRMRCETRAGPTIGMEPLPNPQRLAASWRLALHLAEIWCNDCTRYREIAIEDLPQDLPIPDICLRHVCHLCGGTNLSSRGSIQEHYEMVRAITGKAHRL